MPSGWTPDARQRLEHSTRFFARVERATLECPRCGTVYRFSDRIPSAVFNPTTARFTCNHTGCKRTYVLGLVAWPVTATPGVASAPPEDQVPDERELAQLRREGGGWWLPDASAIRYKRPLETNLTTEDDRLEEED